MGYLVDDPSKPQDLGDAAKRFFNEGASKNFARETTPISCPMFTINNHVLDWLKKPINRRYALALNTVQLSHNVDGFISGAFTIIL
jgi:hypothetical protein